MTTANAGAAFMVCLLDISAVVFVYEVFRGWLTPNDSIPRPRETSLVQWSRCHQPDFGDLHTAFVGNDASCFHAPAVIAIGNCIGEKKLLRLEASRKARRNVADRCDWRPGATLVAGEVRVI